MNQEIQSKGTTWKRRRITVAAGVALVALSALGASTMSGTGNAGGGGYVAPTTTTVPTETLVVATATTSKGGTIVYTASRSTGWGG